MIINGDHDLRTILASAPAEGHIFKFVVQNMHSANASKNMGRTASNRLSSPQRFRTDLLRALDKEISKINDAPLNILNQRQYPFFPLNSGHDDNSSSRKRAKRPDSGSFSAPFSMPIIRSNLEWPKGVPEQMNDPLMLLPPFISGLNGIRRSETVSPPTVRPIRPIQPVTSPTHDPVEGLSLDLGLPAGQNPRSALGIQLNGIEEEPGPAISPAAVRPSFNSPAPNRNFAVNSASTRIFTGIQVSFNPAATIDVTYFTRSRFPRLCHRRLPLLPLLPLLLLLPLPLLLRPNPPHEVLHFRLAKPRQIGMPI